MIKCVVIDDEQPAIDVIENYIKRVPNLELAGFSTNPLIGIELVKQHKPDVVFLDIQMDEMNGIEVMKIISPDTKVVFCTAYSEFAVASYDLDAVDYLVKPVAFNRFVKAVQRVSNLIHPQSVDTIETSIPNDYIFVKTEHKGKIVKIDLDDIDFIEGMSNYVTIHRGTQKTLVYSTLKDLEERLPQDTFTRVHKSFIVAITQINAIDNGDIILKNRPERIPISLSYKEAFMHKMQSKLLNS